MNVLLITIGVWLFAGLQIWIFICNVRQEKKTKQVNEELEKLHEVKVTPYLNGKVKFTIDLADERDAVLSLMYVKADKNLRDVINIINALEEPHKVEIVVTTTEE